MQLIELSLERPRWGYGSGVARVCVVGSVNLDNFIRDHKSELAADVVVISDSPMFARGVPSLLKS